MSTVQGPKLPPLYGLVLSGGKSIRMKRDKAILRYHRKPQIVHAFELLSVHCEKVFISNREEQRHIYAEFPQIHDMHKNMGPWSGILSAMSTFPDVAWFVLANDMPYVGSETICTLICHRNPCNTAVAYRNPQQSFPEPLCSIYEPIMRTQLLEFLASGECCFGKILNTDGVQLLAPPNGIMLININHPQEYEHVIQSLWKSMPHLTACFERDASKILL